TGDGVQHLARAINPVMVNNISYANGGAGQLSASTNITSNPLFVNSSPSQAAHFALQAGSPALGVGQQVTALVGFTASGSPIYARLSTDYFGTARPSSGGIDVGALER
ncbi:MAG: choice-of-anchor Q domain-containing protein, partial [Myxococcaceae bacterium]